MKNPIKLESESNAAATKHKGAKQKWRGGEGRGKHRRRQNKQNKWKKNKGGKDGVCL
jgi:hypothetical protein